jgi:hypothetical protein
MSGIDMSRSVVTLALPAPPPELPPELEPPELEPPELEPPEGLEGLPAVDPVAGVIMPPDSPTLQFTVGSNHG